jgi:hypothetical protein
MVEVQPLDEQPAGRPDPRTPVQPARNAQGHYQAGHPQTVEAARRAGQARKGNTALAHELVVSDDPAWEAGKRKVMAFIAMHTRTLRDTVGGGVADSDVKTCT